MNKQQYNQRIRTDCSRGHAGVDGKERELDVIYILLVALDSAIIKIQIV